jgi:dTDP-4-amino-4,6-dideoxygalactose transaminase
MTELRVRVGDFKLGAREKRAINEILDSGRLSEGPKVQAFERQWAQYVGSKHAIATSSGTTALMAALTAMQHAEELGPGRKVITTPLTYIATSSAITNVGWEPVYVDVDPQTFVITPENVEEHLSQAPDPENYALILPVHLMGYPADMAKMVEVAQRYNLRAAEDSAQAHGSLYHGQRTGSLGYFGTFSFYIAHNIQAGEMGAVTTDDAEVARLVHKIKAQGRACDCKVCVRAEGKCPRLNNHTGDDDYDPRFKHELIGYNFKTMEFQAALGLTQLERVDWILKQRQGNVRFLNRELAPFADILQLPLYSDRISYLAYPLVIRDPDIISRKVLRHRLEEHGIETRPLFGCIPTQQPAYGHLKAQYQDRLPVADYLGHHAFYVGCHQYLNQDDLSYMVRAFQEILRPCI